MCTSCGHTRNWNNATRRCGCGCTTRKGEPGSQGPRGNTGPSGGLITVDIYTPFAGGGQGSATQLLANDNLINTVISDGDSVKLLPALKNGSQQVRNYGDKTVNVFPYSGDQIDALGLNIFYPLTAGNIANFVCFTTGTYTT